MLAEFTTGYYYSDSYMWRRERGCTCLIIRVSFSSSVFRFKSSIWPRRTFALDIVSVIISRAVVAFPLFSARRLPCSPASPFSADTTSLASSSFDTPAYKPTQTTVFTDSGRSIQKMLSLHLDLITINSCFCCTIKIYYVPQFTCKFARLSKSELWLLVITWM